MVIFVNKKKTSNKKFFAMLLSFCLLFVSVCAYPVFGDNGGFPGDAGTGGDPGDNAGGNTDISTDSSTGGEFIEINSSTIYEEPDTLTGAGGGDASGSAGVRGVNGAGARGTDNTGPDGAFGNERSSNAGNDPKEFNDLKAVNDSKADNDPNAVTDPDAITDPDTDLELELDPELDEAMLYGLLPDEDLESFDFENAEQLAAEYILDEIIVKFKDPRDVPGKEKQLQHEIEKLENETNEINGLKEAHSTDYKKLMELDGRERETREALDRMYVEWEALAD